MWAGEEGEGRKMDSWLLIGGGREDLKDFTFGGGLQVPEWGRLRVSISAGVQKARSRDMYGR
eukprot:1138134-Pelagomonas_calceolata.AAC.2